MIRSTNRPAVLLLGLSLVAASCTISDPLSADCTPERLDTVTPQALTLSTGAVTRAPWVIGGDPAAGTSGDPNDGQGYDAAVGYAVAAQLGYERDAVTWVATPFSAALAAGDKPFDVNVNQATITDRRRADVDLTTPYYEVRQVLVSTGNERAEAVRSIADLSALTVSVMTGSPGERLVRTLAAGATVLPYDDIDDVVGAVGNLRADALVVDLPTALAVTASDDRLQDGTIVATLPRPDDPGEAFAMVLTKDSPLTPCVDAALAQLRDDGSLDALERTWLMTTPGWPELT